MVERTFIRCNEIHSETCLKKKLPTLLGKPVETDTTNLILMYIKPTIWYKLHKLTDGSVTDHPDGFDLINTLLCMYSLFQYVIC